MRRRALKTKENKIYKKATNKIEGSKSGGYSGPKQQAGDWWRRNKYGEIVENGCSR